MKRTNFGKTLAVFFLLSLSALWANALDFTYTSSGTTLKYKQIGSTTTVEVSDNGDKTLSTVVIPSTVTYDGTTYTVTRVADSGFRNNTNLTSIRYPYTLKRIGSYAFSGCSSLCQFHYGAASSKLCYIISSFTELGVYCFEGCAFERVILNVENVEYQYENRGAFFKNCTSLKTATVTGPVPVHCFLGCTALTSVQICETTVSESVVGEYAFYGCTALTDVKFVDNSAWVIGEEAFGKCSSLTNVTFGEGLVGIRAYAFENSGLPSVVFPSSLNTLAGRSFYNCDNLTSVTIKSAVANQLGDPLCEAFKACSNLTNLTFGAGVTAIAEGTAQDMTSLTTVELPTDGSLTKIGRRAFKDCCNLSTISPLVCSEIGEEAFMGTSIDELDVDCPTIGYNAFSQITGLQSAALRQLRSTIKPCFVGSGNNGRIRILPKDKAAFGTIYASPLLNSCFSFAGLDCCNMEEIPSNIFSRCPFLETIILKNPSGFGVYYGMTSSCPSMKEYAFENGDSITADYRLMDGCVYSADGTKLLLAPEGRTTRICPPATLREIGVGASYPALVYDLTWVNSTSNVVDVSNQSSYGESFTVIVTSEGATAFTQSSSNSVELNKLRSKWLVLYTSGNGNGDLNNDGAVSIGDVSKLVNLILSR